MIVTIGRGSVGGSMLAVVSQAVSRCRAASNVAPRPSQPTSIATFAARRSGAGVAPPRATLGQPSSDMTSQPAGRRSVIRRTVSVTYQ